MIAAKPPMGWNSWNTFGKDIDEELIFQIADTILMIAGLYQNGITMEI